MGHNLKCATRYTVPAARRPSPVAARPLQVVESNKAYTVSFATSGKDSRTTQMFINFADNANLDGMGFSPFAKVTRGHGTVDKIVKKHGETPDQGT